MSIDTIHTNNCSRSADCDRADPKNAPPCWHLRVASQLDMFSFSPSPSASMPKLSTREEN